MDLTGFILPFGQFVGKSGWCLVHPRSRQSLPGEHHNSYQILIAKPKSLPKLCKAFSSKMIAEIISSYGERLMVYDRYSQVLFPGISELPERKGPGITRENCLDLIQKSHLEMLTMAWIQGSEDLKL